VPSLDVPSVGIRGLGVGDDDHPVVQRRPGPSQRERAAGAPGAKRGEGEKYKNGITVENAKSDHIKKIRNHRNKQKETMKKLILAKTCTF